MQAPKQFLLELLDVVLDGLERVFFLGELAHEQPRNSSIVVIHQIAPRVDAKRVVFE